MKKFAFILSAFVLLTSFSVFNNVWTNDDPHSQLGFTVTHLGISDISGGFNDFDAKVTSSKPDFSDAVFELTAKVASIDTRVEARDNHLKSADFFDAAKFPELKFKSNSLSKTAENKYKLQGDLTFHGITKPVSLDLEYKGAVENPMSKKQTAGFKIKGIIKRSDYNLGSGFPEAIISNEVRIEANGEFVQ
jgi:polyisoprenoid-binding protein YceI